MTAISQYAYLNCRVSIRAEGLLPSQQLAELATTPINQLAGVLANLGGAETALLRLLAEQRKTQTRVNALRYNVIPRYRATVRFITAALEEEERNTLYQIKILQ